MSCQSCSMIEGFSDETPAAFIAPNMPTQELVGMPKPPAGYMPYMKSECNYAAQACIYTAQGEVVCPKEGLGNCGDEKKESKGFLGLFQ